VGSRGGGEEGGQQCVFCALGGFIWVKLGRFSCMCLGYVMVVWVAVIGESIWSRCIIIVEGCVVWIRGWIYSKIL
jgi:hypothetical protein